MAWVNTYLNQTPATWGIGWYTLKEMLKACGWTITRSGDGSSAYSASGDVITTGAAGVGGFGNTAAWFVAQQPSNGVAPYAGTRQICVQRSTSPSTQARIKYSVAAGFTGGTPGFNRVPSATDEQVILGGGTDASPTYAAFWPGTEGLYRVQFRGDDGASATNNHVLYVLAYLTGGSTTAMVFALDCCKTGTFPAEDTDPYMIWHLVGDVTGSSLTTETAGSGWRGYLKRGMVGEGFVAIPPAVFYSTAGSTHVAPGTLGANPHNGKDDMFPLFWMRRSGLAAPSGYKGQAQMTKTHGPTRATRDLLSHLQTGDRIVAGLVNFPWPTGTVPTA